MSEETKTAPPFSDEDKRRRRAEYNRAYYEKHGASLRDKKQSRYHSDPSYRDRVKSDSADRRSRIEKNSGTAVRCGDGDAIAFRATALADRLGVSISTINFWQKHGTLPETPFRTPGGYRLYTSDMIEVVKQALGAYPRPNKGCPLFLSHVSDGWRAIGVPAS